MLNATEIIIILKEAFSKSRELLRGILDQNLKKVTNERGVHV